MNFLCVYSFSKVIFYNSNIDFPNQKKKTLERKFGESNGLEENTCLVYFDDNIIGDSLLISK